MDEHMKDDMMDDHHSDRTNDMFLENTMVDLTSVECPGNEMRCYFEPPKMEGELMIKHCREEWETQQAQPMLKLYSGNPAKDIHLVMVGRATVMIAYG